MLFLYDNVATLAIAVLAGAFAWLYGGIVASALTPVIPWLFALLVEAMFCFPQRRPGESTYDARERCWYGLKRDPITWVTLGFAVLLMIPFVNTGLCPSCDYHLIVDGASEEPPVRFLPYCVRRLQHLNVVMWFVPSLVAMLAVKHSLLKRGKRQLVELIVWNGMLLGLFGMLEQVLGADAPLWGDFKGPKVYFFSTFGYPNMGGDYFTTLFCLAIATWRWKLDVAFKDELRQAVGDAPGAVPHRAFWRKHLILVPALVCFFSAMMTLSRAAIVLVSAAAILFFVHTLVFQLARMPRIRRVKAVLVSFVAVGAIALATAAYMPRNIQREVGSIGSREVFNRLSGKNQYHSRVATEIWMENFLFGCGGWGYKHFSLSKLTDADMRSYWASGAANVHNDSLQFLCEHGTVGFGCLVAIVILLLWPVGRIWKALIADVRFTPPRERPPRPVAIFALPGSAFCILTAVTCTYVHSFSDCPMRSPAVLSLFFISLAAIDGYLPRLRDE